MARALIRQWPVSTHWHQINDLSPVLVIVPVGLMAVCLLHWQPLLTDNC